MNYCRIGSEPSDADKQEFGMIILYRAESIQLFIAKLILEIRCQAEAHTFSMIYIGRPVLLP
jgi:hypothetical protein